MNKVRLPDTCIRDETEHGKEYVLLADVRTYGDQRAAEAREQMREECRVVCDRYANNLAKQVEKQVSGHAVVSAKDFTSGGSA